MTRLMIHPEWIVAAIALATVSALTPACGSGTGTDTPSDGGVEASDGASSGTGSSGTGSSGTGSSGEPGDAGPCQITLTGDLVATIPCVVGAASTEADGVTTFTLVPSPTPGGVTAAFSVSAQGDPAVRTYNPEDTIAIAANAGQRNDAGTEVLTSYNASRGQLNRGTVEPLTITYVKQTGTQGARKAFHVRGTFSAKLVRVYPAGSGNVNMTASF